MSKPIAMEEDLENKKRKADAERTRSTITNYFSIAPKTPTSPPILKKERHSNSKED